MVYLFDVDGTILLAGGAGYRAINRSFRAVLRANSCHENPDEYSPGSPIKTPHAAPLRIDQNSKEWGKLASENQRMNARRPWGRNHGLPTNNA